MNTALFFLMWLTFRKCHPLFLLNYIIIIGLSSDNVHLNNTTSFHNKKHGGCAFNALKKTLDAEVYLIH